MHEPLIAHTERETAFVATAPMERMQRVAWSIFPMVVDPELVPHEQADFMRPTDWIVGVRIGDEARCYPAWMLDNSHVVNDTFAGLAIAVMHCEICCSNAVYLAEHANERLLFRTAGLYGGTLSPGDVNTRSVWSHGQGVALEGPLAGTVLPLIQSFQASYREWTRLFPATTVMQYPRPADHPDARHGHGSEVTFAQAGMDAMAVASMDVGNDPRLPENEIVVTLNVKDGSAVLPLRELARAGGVFHADVKGLSLVTFSAGPTSAMTGTFRCRHPDGDTELGFEATDGAIRDRQTGSTWRVDGLAVAGPLAGKRLEPFPTVTSKWHSLACFLPGVRLLAHEGPAAPVPLGDAAPAVEALREAGFAVDVGPRLYDLALPDAARQGVRVRVEDDPFDLLLFEDATTAEDQCPARAVRSDRLVLVSQPDRQLADDATPLSDAEIAWSERLDDPRFQRAVASAADALPERSAHPEPNITRLLERLDAAGYATDRGTPVFRDGIPERALSGRFVTIAGDPFVVYRFASEADAEACAPERAHSLVAGPFVLRSDPPDVYYLPFPRGTKRKPDDEVPWSRLLEDAAFRAAFEHASGATRPRA